MTSVLITGGTGSLGRALTSRLLSEGIERVAVLSRDECKHADMLAEFDNDKRLRCFVGDVRDQDRIHLAMRGVDLVIHAAAMKRIEACERDPGECEKTNVIGSRNVINAALSSPSVKRVMLVSTDKAAAPYTAYGASKMQAEAAFIGANNYSGWTGPKFGVVRYGNVVGSRGSVVPLFQKLIAEGAKYLPITDPRMTRFWITMPQAVDFVWSSLNVMWGGEIFIPRIPSAYVTDIAAAIAPNTPRIVTGLRSFEKLHETMISADQAPNVRDLEDRYVIEPTGQAFWDGSVYADRARVRDDWSYASNTNPDWLGVEAFRRLLNIPEEIAA